MITGDNITSAKQSAVELGIITEEEKNDASVCMEGFDFYQQVGGLDSEDNKNFHVKDLDAFKRTVSKMRVMARSHSAHKECLVIGLMEMNRVVGVTGEGTNEAPAVAKADVGFAMAISGTDVIK